MKVGQLVILFAFLIFVSGSICHAETKAVAELWGKEITEEQLIPPAKLQENYSKAKSKDEYAKWYHSFRINALRGLIFGPLLHRYAEEHGIRATEEEIEEALAEMKKAEASLNSEYEKALTKEKENLKSPNITEKERKDSEASIKNLEYLLGPKKDAVTAMRKKMVENMIVDWKTNSALFHDYGGRVIFQQFGMEPIDAYRQFLEKHEQAGDFKIYDDWLANGFWRYFRDDTMHQFMKKDPAKYMEIPFWRMKKKGSD